MSDTGAEPTTDDAIEVVRSDEHSRYEILVGGTLAGVAEIRDRADLTIFRHTEVYEEFRGRGLASTLVSEAIRDTVARDRVIVPVCPLVRRWLSEHDVPGARIREPQD